MITLDDALNRNYYFFQGNGEVRRSFLQSVFQTFIGYDFNNFVANKVNMLIKNGYNREGAYIKAYHQAVETSLRCCEAIPKYRKEIKKKFQEQPSLRGGITDEQIDSMLYTELKTLRTNLGLSKRGKKVVKQEPAPAKTIEKAKTKLKERTTTEIAGDMIYQYSLDLDTEPVKPHHEIEEIYSVEEAMMAYPGYSVEELRELGIHVTDPKAEEKIARYNIINNILDFNITIAGEELTIENLANLNKEDLLEVYNAVRKMNRVMKKYTKK